LNREVHARSLGKARTTNVDVVVGEFAAPAFFCKAAGGREATNSLVGLKYTKFTVGWGKES